MEGSLIVNKIKVLFLGTSEFSKNCLENLFQNSHFEVQEVWTKPDSPSGQRGLRLTPSPVKKFCLEKSISCFTPDIFPAEGSIDLDVDVVVVVGYGFLIPSYFLNQFKVVNIHTSLLPRWRGAAPVAHCLIHGDSKTGVTLQEVVPQLDAGDIIRQIEFSISSEMNSLDVLKKMEGLAKELLIQTLPFYLKNKIQTQKQDESLVTYAPKIKNSDLKIDWKNSAQRISQSMRAFVSEGGMYTYYGKQRVKIFRAEIVNFKGSPGCVLECSRNLIIACGNEALSIKDIQREGKKRQPIEEFMRGFKVKDDQLFT